MLLRLLCLSLVVFDGIFGVATATAAQDTSKPHGLEVSAAVNHDVSPPLRELPPAARKSGPPTVVPWRHGPTPVTNPAGHTIPPNGSAQTLNIPSTSTNFDGVGQGFSGPQGTFTVNGAPPDTNGSVGPNH